MNLSELLQRPIMGMPLWLWAGVVGGGGIVLAIYLKRRSGSSSSGALGQNASSQPIDPNIDPYTGVPYSIESQINPATGLPAYYGGPGVDNGSGTQTPTPTPTQPTGGDNNGGKIILPPGPGGHQRGPNGGLWPTDPVGGTMGGQFTTNNPGFTGQYSPTGVPIITGTPMGAARGPYQATPWWPQATDLDALAHGREG